MKIGTLCLPIGRVSPVPSKKESQDFMLSQRRWDILHKLELRQRELSLNRLTIKEGLEIFKELYQFTQKIDKNSYRKLGLRNSRVLAKTHLLFMEVKT